MFPRRTTTDVEICGATIPANSRVMLCYASVNRDDARFALPDQIDLNQADGGHMTFGGGNHRCLGSHLARRELRIMVEEFHSLIPEYEIAAGFEPEVIWPSGTLHLASLPLIFNASGGAS
jgi:cytochrome P450